VLSVASAISKALQVRPIFPFLRLSAGGADKLERHFMLSTWLLSPARCRIFLPTTPTKNAVESPTSESSQPLKGAEQSPLFRQDEVRNRRDIGNPGKVKRRHNVGHAVLPPEKECPEADLKQVNNNQKPRDPNQ